jgi:hypothetical protein
MPDKLAVFQSTTANNSVFCNRSGFFTPAGGVILPISFGAGQVMQTSGPGNVLFFNAGINMGKVAFSAH